MAVETTEQANDLIRTWINDRGLFDPTANPDDIPDEYHFSMGGKMVNGLPFSIIQPKDLKKAVVVVADVELSEEHFDAFNDMDIKDREALLWNLRKEIMFAPPTHSFNPEFQKNGIFRGFQFTQLISYDELTRGKLEDTVISVTKCVLWVIWTFRREFGPLKEQG